MSSGGRVQADKKGPERASLCSSPSAPLNSAPPPFGKRPRCNSFRIILKCPGGLLIQVFRSIWAFVVCYECFVVLVGVYRMF